MTELELQYPIVEHYLRTGVFATVRQLAEQTSYSESAIRSNLDDMPEGIVMIVQRRSTYSRVVPAVKHGEQRVHTYGPSIDLLASMLRHELGIEKHTPVQPKLPGHKDSP